MEMNYAKTRERNPEGTFAKPSRPSGFNVKEYKREYHIKNRERLVRKSIEWGKKNKEKRKIIKNKWRAKNREYTNFLTRQYIYRRKGAKSYPTPMQVTSLYEKYLNLCAYCDLNKADTIDHVVPLSRGGMNNIDNLLPACRSCNSSKGRKLLNEWKPEIYGK